MEAAVAMTVLKRKIYDMGKDKLRKFRENETFRCLVQPATSEVLGCDHYLKGNWGRDFFGNDKINGS